MLGSQAPGLNISGVSWDKWGNAPKGNPGIFPVGSRLVLKQGTRKGGKNPGKPKKWGDIKIPPEDFLERSPWAAKWGEKRTP